MKAIVVIIASLLNACAWIGVLAGAVDSPEKFANPTGLAALAAALGTLSVLSVTFTISGLDD